MGKKDSLQQSISKKWGDKESPVATFVANAFLPLDTADLNHASQAQIAVQNLFHLQKSC